MRQEDKRELIEGVMRGKISRRQFLTKALVMGISASTIGTVLAACGGNAGGSTPGATTPGATTGTGGTGGGQTPTTSTGATTPTTGTGTGATTPATGMTPSGASTTAAGTAPALGPSGTAGGSSASQAAPMLKPTINSGTPTGGEFHAAWPYTAPPQGQYNTFIAYAIPAGTGYLYELQEMALAFYNWSENGYYPLLATSWEVMPPDKMRIHLREGVKWSDGKPFSSKDVITTFTILRMQGAAMWEYLGSVKAEDDHTVLFTMKQPSTVVPYYVLEEHMRADSLYGKFAQQAQALFDKGAKPDDKRLTKLNEDLNKFKPKDVPVTGPYKIDINSVTNAQLTLEKVDTAWNADQVNFDRLIVYNGETDTVTPLVLAKQVDFATHGFAVATVKQFLQIGIDVERPPTHSGVALNFNFKKYKEFGDPKVRQALAFAIDKQENSIVALAESAKPSKYMTGVSDAIISNWLSDDELSQMESYKHDPDKAAKMLQEAGWKKSGSTWQTPEGKPAQYEIAAPAEYANQAATASNLTDQLNAFGFRTKVRPITFTQFSDRINSGKFEIGLESWGAGNPHPYFAWQSDLFAYNIDVKDSGGGINFPMTQTVPGLGKLDLEKLTYATANGLNVDQQRATVLKMAKAYNYLLPQIPLHERYGNTPVLKDVRVTGWPGTDDELWKNDLYGDNPVAWWIHNGTLKGVKK